MVIDGVRVPVLQIQRSRHAVDGLKHKWRLVTEEKDFMFARCCFETLLSNFVIFFSLGVLEKAPLAVFKTVLCDFMHCCFDRSFGLFCAVIIHQKCALFKRWLQ